MLWQPKIPLSAKLPRLKKNMVGKALAICVEIGAEREGKVTKTLILRPFQLQQK